jgi:hypothetical protein
MQDCMEPRVWWCWQHRTHLGFGSGATVIDEPDSPHKKYELDSVDACLYRLRYV